MPKISVCLPVYNGESFLAEAIESVLAQTYEDFELLIADDCSSDRSAQIAKEYAARDKRIQVWVNSQNVGLFANYNVCIEKAQGEYVKLFAQDDLLHRQILELEAAALAERPHVKLVSCAKEWIDGAGHTLQTLRPFPETRLLPGRDVIRYNLLQLTNWVGEPSTVMFRRADAGVGFDTAFYHYGDIEYWFRLVEGGEYLFLNEVLCKFRRHGGSSTTSNLSGLYFALDMLRIGKKYRGYCGEIGESEEHFVRRALELAARHIDRLIQDEGLTAEEVMSIRKGTPEQQAEQLAAFKELSFHALRYMSKLLVDCHSLRCTVNDLDEMVQDVRSNPLWKISRPLRKIAGSQVPGVDPSIPKVSSGKPCSPAVYHREGC